MGCAISTSNCTLCGHHCHNDTKCTCSHLIFGQTPIKYKKQWVKKPITKTHIVPKSSTSYETKTRYETKTEYIKHLTPRFVSTYDHRGGYWIQDERIETVYKQVPITYTESKTTTSDTYTTEVVDYKWEEVNVIDRDNSYKSIIKDVIHCKCTKCNCWHCYFRLKTSNWLQWSSSPKITNTKTKSILFNTDTDDNQTSNSNNNDNDDIQITRWYR